MESYNPKDFREYVEKTGLKKIKVKHLNKIIDEKGIEVLGFQNFGEIYKLVSDRESNSGMSKLTWWIAGMTLITTVCTIFSAFK